MGSDKAGGAIGRRIVCRGAMCSLFIAGRSRYSFSMTKLTGQRTDEVARRLIRALLLAGGILAAGAGGGRVAAADTASLRSGAFLLGTEKGLYKATPTKTGTTSGEQTAFNFQPLWSGGSVRTIVSAPYGWYFITSSGIIFSGDLSKFENRSAGLPTRTLVELRQEGSVPRREALEIKALAVDPIRQGRIAACTASEVFVSENRGVTWASLGSPSSSPGLKTLAFAPAREQASGAGGTSYWALWVAHAMRGVFRRDYGEQTAWVQQSAGLPRVFGSNIQEVSSFALFPGDGEAAATGSPSAQPLLLSSLTFLRQFYRFDLANQKFVEVYTDGGDFSVAESLHYAWGDSGYCVGRGGIQSVSFNAKTNSLRLKTDTRLTALLTEAMAAAAQPATPALQQEEGVGSLLADTEAGAGPVNAASGPGLALCAGFPGGFVQKNSNPFSLNELWLLNGSLPMAGTPEQRARLEKAGGKNCIYLQTGFVIDPQSRENYFELINRLGMNGLVVDLKDDEGRLRFVPQSEMLKETGSSAETLDLETFVLEAKARGIYLIARIVVFKDASLYRWNGGALAVRNTTTGATWQGTKADGSPIQELWVDPYSSDVWAYNVEIAKEAIARGFDEIQFDYIRFPTDGENIGVIDFPHKLPGMTQETALESFLRYARQAIAAPISIDIYGSNGWYRSGSRTGQDVEMLSNYVDVICPMLYPSHFEQDFLAFAPAELRPYRIYKIGTLRNQTIARGKVLIRPYVQAFYLNVSYDKAYYGASYVQKEIQGVKEGANQGMIFWNNSGRYSDLESKE